MRSRRFLQGAVFALGVATFAGCGGGGGGFRSETTDFFFTGQQETFTVPSGVTRLRIVAGGASGSHTTAFDGGHGALVDATVDVTPGEVLTILVGEQPALQAFGDDGCGASGGGGTFVVRGTTILDTTPIVVAGGGGGGADYESYDVVGGDASTTTTGGSSGSLLGGIGGLGGD
ncbi:MAG: hypothetical protein H6826_10245, partial [Planctomycetes bacterium]|nr:hypothetical protein [Planctomycetota bacterium]